jgi:hypothetical protein
VGRVSARRGLDDLRALTNAYWAGYVAGHRAAEDEMAADWHEMWVKTRAVLDQPTHAELERRRGSAA